jgi:WD40 repeat protein
LVLALEARSENLKVWDPQTGHRIREVGLSELEGASCLATFFGLDGLRVVTVEPGSHEATVWDADDRQVLVRLPHFSSEFATFSPGGSRLVTADGDEDGTARVWDAQSGAVVLKLKGHIGPIHSATFSPDGSRLVTGGADGTARVWDAVMFKEWTGAELRLISCWDGSGPPTAGTDLVIVGTDSDGLLHIRAFGGNTNPISADETRGSSGALHLKRFGYFIDGRMWSEALESSLPTTQSRAITTLKQQLPRLLPPHVLSGAERGQILSAITLILGHRPRDW